MGKMDQIPTEMPAQENINNRENQINSAKETLAQVLVSNRFANQPSSLVVSVDQTGNAFVSKAEQDDANAETIITITEAEVQEFRNRVKDESSLVNIKKIAQELIDSK